MEEKTVDNTLLKLKLYPPPPSQKKNHSGFAADISA